VTVHAVSGENCWPQWGGATRDFKVDASGLANEWPGHGPVRIWAQPIGDGHSGVVASGDRLYTMYRENGDEVVVALSAADGTSLWKHRYAAPIHEQQTGHYGYGPNATPLLVGDRIVTVGFTGLLHAFDASTGRVLWSYDLVKDLHGKVQYYGYSSSPIAYKSTIIALVGGKNCGVVSLKPEDGSILWQSAENDISYASPVLINVDGKDQIVFFSPTEVIGLDPTNGSYLWRHPVINFCRTNCTSVIWGADNLLWAATKGVGGTRVLKLAHTGKETSVSEVWMDRKIRLYHWNAVRIGDYVYTSIGDTAQRFAAINVKTGNVSERLSGFGVTNTLYAEGKLIILDESGVLTLARPEDGHIKILSRAAVSESQTWTPPTLVGTTLYVRDRERISAYDLN
jgi:outer membrane protein assembly factor BamB